MGAAASVSSLRSLKGDMLSEQFLKDNLGEKFDAVDYSALKNEKGEVPKELLVSVHSSGVDSEVFSLFKEFCGGRGVMELGQFIHFCEDARLLKKKFSRAHAEKLFHQARFRVDPTNTSINYYLLREEVIPEYCRLRDLKEDDFMVSLSQCPGPSKSMSEMEHMKDFRSLGQSLYMASSAIASNSGKEIMASAKVSDATAATTAVIAEEPAEDMETRERNAQLKAEQEAAALKLQKIARGKEARKRLREMREVVICT